MLWKTNNGKLVLHGSIHATDSPKLSLGAEFEQAYAAASRIVFEADIGSPPDLSIALLPDGESLRSSLPDTLFSAVADEWAALSLPPEELEHIKPWFAANRIAFARLAQHGFSVECGVDKQLWVRAASDGKEVLTLETANDGLSCFDDAPITEQQQYLSIVSTQRDLFLSEFTALLAAWRRGDTAHITRLLDSRLQLFPRLFTRLVIDRNHSWLPRLYRWHSDGVQTLVVAGCLHFVGPHGIPQLFTHGGILSRIQ